MNHEMMVNEFGKIVWDTWEDLPNHNANISLDAFVVMPDHVHGVVIVRDMDIETPHVGPGSEPDPTLNGVPNNHQGFNFAHGK
jgi:hypothetical protein